MPATSVAITCFSGWASSVGLFKTCGASLLDCGFAEGAAYPAAFSDCRSLSDWGDEHSSGVIGIDTFADVSGERHQAVSSFSQSPDHANMNCAGRNILFACGCLEPSFQFGDEFNIKIRRNVQQPVDMDALPGGFDCPNIGRRAARFFSRKPPDEMAAPDAFKGMAGAADINFRVAQIQHHITVQWPANFL